MPNIAEVFPIRYVLPALIFCLGLPPAPAPARCLFACPPDTSLTSAGLSDTTQQHAEGVPKSARAIADSILAADSLGRMSTPSLVGTFDRMLDSSSYLSRRDMQFLDFRYLGEMLQTLPGVFVVDQNSAGSYSELTMRGNDWRGIAVMKDGRPLNDPASGIYNLYQFSPEYTDRIEVITGPRAFLYGLNSTGGAINLVTKNYNSNKPFTKIDYSEGSYGYAYSDGTFSQNISRKVNLTFGFQHQSTDGRYANGESEEWNMRVKVRYNVSRDFNVILSEYLTSTFTDFNGGVTPAAALSSQAFLASGAPVVNTGAYEKTTRHDVDLTLVGTLLPDTIDVSTLTFFYSHDLREYRDEQEEGYAYGTRIHSDQVSSWMGAVLTQNLDTKLQRLSLGGTLELRQIEGSPNLGRIRHLIGDAWGKEEIPLGEVATLAGFGRYDEYLGTRYFGAGSDLSLKIGDVLTAYGGLSYSRRLPTFEELFWTDSTVARAGPITAEKHVQSEIGMELRLPDGGSLRATLFHHTVLHPITILPYGTGFVFPGLEFTNGGTVTTYGIDLRARVRLWFLTLEGAGTYLLQRSGDVSLQEFPKLTVGGGLYIWNTLLDGKLDLKTGVRGRFTSAFVGDVFNPEVLAYVPNTGSRIGYSSTADFFLIAKIGDAFFHLMWTNLTDVQYFATPYYPGLDREVRIAVYWEFLN